MVPLSLGVLYLTATGLLCNGAGAGVGGVRGFRADLVSSHSTQQEVDLGPQVVCK